MLDLGLWQTKVHSTGAEAAGLAAQCADRPLRRFGGTPCGGLEGLGGDTLRESSGLQGASLAVLPLE